MAIIPILLHQSAIFVAAQLMELPSSCTRSLATLKNLNSRILTLNMVQYTAVSHRLEMEVNIVFRD
jgi:hypothetical protein